MRKGLVASILAVSMLFGSSVMAADKIDFSAYSDEELDACYADFLEEFKNRNISKTAVIDAGHYIIGEEIPEGSYEVYMDDGIEEVHGYIGTLDENEDYLWGENRLSEYSKENPYRFTLRDEAIFVVEYRSILTTVPTKVLFE